MPARRRATSQTSQAGLAFLQLIQRHGLRNAFWLIDFQASWAIAVRNNDWQPIDAEQYAAYWRMGRAQGYRDQRRWRELVPNEPTPNDRVLAARAEYEKRTAELGHEPSRDDFAAVVALLPAA